MIEDSQPKQGDPGLSLSSSDNFLNLDQSKVINPAHHRSVGAPGHFTVPEPKRLSLAPPMPHADLDETESRRPSHHHRQPVAQEQKKRLAPRGLDSPNHFDNHFVQQQEPGAFREGGNSMQDDDEETAAQSLVLPPPYPLPSRQAEETLLTAELVVPQEDHSQNIPLASADPLVEEPPQCWAKRRTKFIVVGVGLVAIAAIVTLALILVGGRGDSNAQASPSPTPEHTPFPTIEPVPEPAPTGVWIRLGDDILGEGGADWFGFSVSLSASGTIVAAGATQYDTEGNPPGYVRFLAWDGSNWNQLGSTVIGEAPGEEFGHKVSLSANGTIAAVTGHGGNNGSGYVSVLAWNGSDWTKLGRDISGSAAYDYFGSWVSLSADGTIVAIGASGWSIDGEGYVRVLAWDGESWNPLGNDMVGEVVGEEIGTTVSLSADGSIVAVSGSQYVRTFAWDGLNWNPLGDKLYGDSSGSTSVALSADGRVVAMGVSRWVYEGGNPPGYVQVFEWNGSKWSQLGSDLTGRGTGDTFGSVLSLSANGRILAVGTNSGYVSVYGWTGEDWTQIGDAVEGVGGWTVFLSADGAIFATGNSSGLVRVMQLQKT